MAAIDTAYNYYLSTYAGRPASRYDSHKKSELRSIYNTIVKINKESPLYKFNFDGTVQKFAIDIKESAREIQNVVASLSDEDDIGNALRKKIAYSSREDIVTAEYIGHSNDPQTQKEFQVEVLSLARSQVNLGTFLDKKRMDLSPGTYSFNLDNSSCAYEFQFNVNRDDTNYTVQNRIANLISNAGVGLNATIEEDEQGACALRIESVATGIGANSDTLFSISPQSSRDSITAMNVLGIDHVSQTPQNSEFLLNGNRHYSYDNTFTINNAFELTLRGISEEGSPVTIGFKADVDAVADNIYTLIGSYNSIIYTADKYADSQKESSLLYHDMSRAAFRCKNSLESLGLIVDDHGCISIDKARLAEAVVSENCNEKFSVLNDFKNMLSSQANRAAMDPMKYVDKVVVTYKSPGNNLVTPYLTSLYSGMMMDRYC